MNMTDTTLFHQRERASIHDEAVHLYLDLMKRCLVNWIYLDQERNQVPGNLSTLLKRNWFHICLDQERMRVRDWGCPYDPQLRVNGRDRPESAHTMIGLKRLDNVQWCVEDILAHDIPGDLIEAGVWRGGAAIFMRAILKAYRIHNRSVWVADSFEGLPPPNAEKYPHDTGDMHHTVKFLAVSLEQVKANFERYRLLDDQVQFLKGWFRDTLPNAPIERLAVIRLDGDMYESTMDSLVHLYPKLSIGGYVIIDDYGNLPGCRQAVDDYRTSHGIHDEIIPIDWAGVYWQRSS
jgi:O-methyltransferase